jgi:hypothetical protein
LRKRRTKEEEFKRCGIGARTILPTSMGFGKFLGEDEKSF